MKLGWLFALFLLTACGYRSVSSAPTEICSEPAVTTGSWTEMAFPPPGTGAIKPAFAWTGAELVVWGGTGLGTETGSCSPCGGGGAYDPKTNTWRALSSVGAPTPRNWLSGVWTGKYFVTWGGLPAFVHHFTARDDVGGIYDLAQDTWTDVTKTGQPEWRWQHALAWTGREVLVWGGASPENIYFCNGGRFDPEKNIWTAMSLQGAALGCTQPATAWTGTEFLVWGGGVEQAGGGATDTGAAYNPETDTWRTISKAGAPSPRFNPAVVWTGQEMIVYGGSGDFDARAYNRAADSWRKVNLKGSPGPRGGGDAVWTGSEMVVWGASNCDAGGRYDPASDSWQSFSSKGVLTARSLQSMVWTGEAVLIYGGTVGLDLQRDTNSGAQYIP